MHIKHSAFAKVGLAALPLILAFSGCTTTIPVSYTEPARLNMSGIKRIAIKSNDDRAASFISQRLAGTGKYTVATAAELREWERWRTDRKALEELAQKQATAVEVSSADLVAAYLANAVRADTSYGGKVLKTSGKVKEIGKSSRGRYFARLEVGRDSVDVYFAASELNQLASVNKDQTITVIGDCHGFNLPDMEDTAEILRILGAGRSVNITNATFPLGQLPDYPGPVDAVIFLNKELSVKNDTHTEKRTAKDKDGKALKNANGNFIEVDTKIYDRAVTLNIGYQVIRAKDGSPIGQGTKSATANDSNEDPSKVADSSALEAQIINQPLAAITSDMVPTERTLSLKLEKEKENKEAKKEMGGADKLAKAKDYKAAAEAYGKIYAQYKNFAAGYNQALLTEAADGVEAAVGLMGDLAKKTGNATAQAMLVEMLGRLAANKKSAEQ
jgi:hypothetical protein